MRSALFWDVMQGIMINSYWSFWTTYRSHFQGSRNPRRLEGCHETSVRNYHCTPRNIPEERRSHLLRGGNVKLRRDWTDQIQYLSYFKERFISESNLVDRDKVKTLHKLKHYIVMSVFRSVRRHVNNSRKNKTRLFTYNVTLRRVRVTIFAVEKQ
jgi:hypothetical protein